MRETGIRSPQPDMSTRDALGWSEAKTMNRMAVCIHGGGMQFSEQCRLQLFLLVIVIVCDVVKRKSRPAQWKASGRQRDEPLAWLPRPRPLLENACPFVSLNTNTTVLDNGDQPVSMKQGEELTRTSSTSQDDVGALLFRP